MHKVKIMEPSNSFLKHFVESEAKKNDIGFVPSPYSIAFSI